MQLEDVIFLFYGNTYILISENIFIWPFIAYKLCLSNFEPPKKTNEANFMSVIVIASRKFEVKNRNLNHLIFYLNIQFLDSTSLGKTACEKLWHT